MYKERFINYLKFEKRYSEHTIIAYEREIQGLFDFISAESVPFEEIDYRFLRYYFSNLKEQGKEASSVNRAISSLKSFYKFLMREGLVKQNPIALIKSLKTAKKLPVVVEKEKMVRLLDHMNSEPQDFEQTRDFIVLEMLFGTGIRLAELLKIKEQDIDFYNKKILIFGKRSKERFVPIHQTLAEELKRYLNLKKEMNFKNISAELIVSKEGKEAYPKLIYRIVNKYLSTITSQKKRSPHVLRHTFATALLDNGADLNAIKELLGHAGLSATQVYTHNSAERLKSIYKQAHPKA
ncbi:tyrosine-type recombinase/integrase [Sphingobacterium daejeonense]|jgi:integrase/recombinase XerC|uniref:Tyrosine recombinase XerC n=1 Tax=Sphingobacterium daejeonense TaxID=371142 RepID=A0ABW3RPQ2_9SPHI|nr:tyrosine-type recombinase/integrase [Sphingobacterium daejeonense]VTP96979.1 Tyrosine recombinase XerC [Sphingobacterium daejeonense]